MFFGKLPSAPQARRPGRASRQPSASVRATINAKRMRGIPIRSVMYLTREHGGERAAVRFSAARTDQVIRTLRSPRPSLLVVIGGLHSSYVELLSLNFFVGSFQMYFVKRILPFILVLIVGYTLGYQDAYRGPDSLGWK